MTQLFGGLNNWDRVPEFRLLDKKRLKRRLDRKRVQNESFITRFVPGSRNSGTRSSLCKPPHNKVMSPKSSPFYWLQQKGLPLLQRYSRLGPCSTKPGVRLAISFGKNIVNHVPLFDFGKGITRESL